MPPQPTPGRASRVSEVRGKRPRLTRQRKLLMVGVVSTTWLVIVSVAVVVGLLTGSIGWAIAASLLTSAVGWVACGITLTVVKGWDVTHQTLIKPMVDRPRLLPKLPPRR